MAADILAYKESQFLTAGCADRPVTVEAIENEIISTPSSASSAFVYYVRLIGLRRGDRVRLSISAPDGSVLAGREVGIDRDEAVRWSFVGKRAEGGGFAMGRYRASARLLRDGKTVLSRDDHLALGE
ncbi:MAG: M23 family peptidase, partial [Sphingobium sp.]